MNIDDVKPDKEVKCVLDMFNRQRVLMEKYDLIEARNNVIVPKPPYNLDDRIVQYRIKDLFWRVTEELMEAMESIAGYGKELEEWKNNWERSFAIRHFFEEISDALHFLVEASIISGIDEKSVEEIFDSKIYLVSGPYSNSINCIIPGSVELRCYIFHIIYWMGVAANIFKNKPWKQTEVPTDVLSYKAKVTWGVWLCFRTLLTYLQCTESDMYELYTRKWKVNQWRQDTQY